MPDFIEPGLLVPIVIIVVLVIVIFSAGYRKAPPDKAFIISGLRRKAKVVIGRRLSNCRSSSAATCWSLP